MSQWLHISAHPLPSAGRRRPVTCPSHAGPLQHSLDAPTLQLDRRLRRSTLWRFYRSIRPSSSLPQTSLSLILRLSGSWEMQQTGFASQITAQAIGGLWPAWWCSSATCGSRWRRLGRGQGLLPWCSDFPQRPLWACGERIRWALHRSTEGVTGYATLPAKRSSSAAAQSRLKTAPTQQPAKPAPAISAPQSAKTQQTRGRSRSARRHPFPKRQGPRPKIALDPAPPTSSWSAGQEEERVESRHGQTATKRPLLNLFSPRVSAAWSPPRCTARTLAFYAQRWWRCWKKEP